MNRKGDVVFRSLSWLQGYNYSCEGFVWWADGSVEKLRPATQGYQVNQISVSESREVFGSEYTFFETPPSTSDPARPDLATDSEPRSFTTSISLSPRTDGRMDMALAKPLKWRRGQIAPVLSSAVNQSSTGLAAVSPNGQRFAGFAGSQGSYSPVWWDNPKQPPFSAEALAGLDKDVRVVWMDDAGTYLAQSFDELSSMSTKPTYIDKGHGPVLLQSLVTDLPPNTDTLNGLSIDSSGSIFGFIRKDGSMVRNGVLLDPDGT